MTALAIATHNLTCMYGPQAALNNVTLSVEPGSVYALVGSNGAGKTTLIELLMNLMRPASGAAELLGIPVGQLRGAALNRIGYVAESQNLPEWMTVEELLDYLRPFYPTWDVELEAELVGDFGLPMRRKLKQLSRGMKMKAAFIGALSYRPELLVLDEPFSGLDPLVRDELIQSLVERIGDTTLFLSSHDLAEVEGFASHIGYLEDGSLLFSEEMASLSHRFRKVEFVVDSLSALPTKLPPAWMEFEQAGLMMRFAHSRFALEAEALAEIRALVPSAGEVTFSAMSLKAIFMAMARTHRKSHSLVDSKSGAESTFGGRA